VDGSSNAKVEMSPLQKSILNVVSLFTCIMALYRVPKLVEHVGVLENFSNKPSKYQASWRINNALDTYSETVRFEPRPGHRFTLLRYS
jgi:hypothetical protein